RTHDLNDPLGFAKEWHDVTNATVEPYFRSTLEFDRHRLAEIDAQIAGVPYEPDDPGWKLGRRLQAGGGADPYLLRGLLQIASLIATPEEVFAENGMIERALRVGGPLEDTPAPGPSRAELLATVAG